MQDFDEQRARHEAHRCARAGFTGFALAFNHCRHDYLEWRYTEDVQQRFTELAEELVQLVTTGTIEPNPLHQHYLLAQAAKKDTAVQKLLAEAAHPRRKARRK